MKFAVFFSLLAVGYGLPRNLMNVNEKNFRMTQDIDYEDDAIRGYYSWLSPDGENQFYVSYIADENGYRVLDSNVVPVSLDGVKVDGTQGSFDSHESAEHNNSSESLDHDSVEDPKSVEDHSPEDLHDSFEDPDNNTLEVHSHSVEDTKDKDSLKLANGNGGEVDDSDNENETNEENKDHKNSRSDSLEVDDLFERLLAVYF